MKNNKGFVVSAVLYPLLVLFLALIMGLISMSSTRKNILDNMKMEISDSIFDSVTCNCEEINETLKQYNQKFTSIDGDITSINETITKMKEEITNIKKEYVTTDTTDLLDSKITFLTNKLTELTGYVNTLAKNELNIYMSPSGNDSNDGLTPAKPMKTLNAVLNKYSNPSLILRLAAGTYDWGSAKIKNRSITIGGVTSDNVSALDLEEWYSSYSRDCGGIYDESGSNCKVIINMKNLFVDGSSIELAYIKILFSEPNTHSIGPDSYLFKMPYEASEAGTTWGSMEVYNSDVLMDHIYISNEVSTHGPGLQGNALLVGGTSLSGTYVSLVGQSKALSAYAFSNVNLDSSYLAATYSCKDVVSCTAVCNHEQSRTSLGQSSVMAATADDYMAQKTSGTLKITYTSKRGKTSGSPTVSAYSS